MDRQQMPFLFRFLSDSELYAFKDGQIISTFNKCGIFFCRKGNVEVSLEDKHFPWCICFIRVRMRKGLWLKRI